MPLGILAARLCPVGSKVGTRVRSLGNVLEACGSALCAHAITAGTAKDLRDCAVMQEGELFKIRKQ